MTYKDLYTEEEKQGLRQYSKLIYLPFKTINEDDLQKYINELEKIVLPLSRVTSKRKLDKTIIEARNTLEIKKLSPIVDGKELDKWPVKHLSDEEIQNNLLFLDKKIQKLKIIKDKIFREFKRRFLKNKNYVSFDIYNNQLSFAEQTRRSKEYEFVLEVKCAYCGKWFKPSKTSVNNRIAALKGMLAGEARLYCKDNCKFCCPTWHARTPDDPWESPNVIKDYSREVQPELRQLVFERDNWTCQKCETNESLQCHHVEGIRWEPLESADIDKCITYCIKCHIEVHKKEGCTYGDMRCPVILRNEKTGFFKIVDDSKTDNNSEYTGWHYKYTAEDKDGNKIETVFFKDFCEDKGINYETIKATFLYHKKNIYYFKKHGLTITRTKMDGIHPNHIRYSEKK